MKFNFSNYIGIFLFFFIIIFSFLLLPTSFVYNADVHLSPYGMALAIGYLEIPFSISKGISGYINNGIFSVYANWPPAGFMILAIWLKIFGNSLLSARLFFLIINELSVVLFYIVLRKNNVSQYIAGVGALLFLVLPYHLTYYSIIFADSWLLFFWLILVWIFSSSSRWKTIFMILVSLLGTFFTWHVILILPAFFTIHLLAKMSIKQKIKVLLGLGLSLILGEVIFIKVFYHHHLIQKLETYSIIGMITTTSSILLFKRVVCLGLECFPLAILFLMQYKTFSFSKIPHSLKQLLLLIGITLFYYLLIFPSWFALHTHQIIMFDLFIGLCIVAILLQWENNIINVFQISFFLGLFSIILYFLIPNFSKQNQKIQKQDEQIVLYINSIKDSDKKSLLFFHLPSINPENPVVEVFAIRNSCNAYTFERLSNQNDPITFMEQNVKKMAELEIVPFEEKTVFLISEVGGIIPQKKMIDSLILQNIKVYKIQLSN